MTITDQLLEPRIKSPEQNASDTVEQFIHNEAIDDLASLFGVELSNDTAGRLAELQGLAPLLNSRSSKDGNVYHERWEAEVPERLKIVNQKTEDGEYGPEGKAVLDIANRLKMVVTTPEKIINPDVAVVLGCAGPGNYFRTKYALANMGNCKTLVFCASTRPVRRYDKQKENNPVRAKGEDRTVPLEEEKLKTFEQFNNLNLVVDDSTTEYELGIASVMSLLGGEDKHLEVIGSGSWGISFKYQEASYDGTSIEKTVTVLKALPPEGKGRADTYDNMTNLLDYLKQITDHPSRILVTTSGYTRPAQDIKVKQILCKAGIDSETIGFSPEYSNFDAKPHNYLDEIKAAIDAISVYYLQGSIQ